MFAIREEIPTDAAPREALLDACFGPQRFAKTSERLREGRLPAQGLALTLEREGRLMATVRLWNVTAGPGRASLLLGPLAVDPALQGLGLGSKLLREALARAAMLGHESVMLVGDAPYYARFGFRTELVEELWLPGPYERERFQAAELRPGALAGARGLVQPTGRAAGRPDLAALVAAAGREAARARAA